MKIVIRAEFFDIELKEEKNNALVITDGQDELGNVYKITYTVTAESYNSFCENEGVFWGDGDGIDAYQPTSITLKEAKDNGTLSKCLDNVNLAQYAKVNYEYDFAVFTVKCN